MSERYEAHRAKTPDLTYSRLVDELKITTPKEGRLPFDPAKARYYDLVASGLLMTDAEKALFRAEGVTNVDHSRQYSMASAYHAIYTRDLPVLVTSDSILHALHRSFDDVLIDLEEGLFTHAIADVLEGAHSALDETPTGEWEESAYNRWLDALRTLDDPPAGGHFPTVMRRTAWQRKQLQTQLASWAELRHDTILYAKQSYGAVAVCEYPEGYVEPYPAFFARVAGLTSELARRLGSLQIPDGLKEAQRLKGARDRQKGFFEGFAKTTRRLEGLARKELAAIPFTAEEAMFLKQTVDIRGGGSGPPEYDGWYPRLIYGGKPTKWDPSVADVHTNANDGVVLEVGVGNVNFIVVAVDNQSDRAAYVGPVYSYYELAQPVSQRMTDEQWRERLEKDNAPPRPPWTAPFRPPAAPRDLGRPEGRRP